MSNWNPYVPDHNPPPGIPMGYPYALNPNQPSLNPMYPTPQASGYPMNTAENNPIYFPNVPAGFPTPAGLSTPLRGFSPYPTSAVSPYPSTGSSSYPSSIPSPYQSSPYPDDGLSGNHIGLSPYSPSSTSPYPPGSSFSPSISPYPPSAYSTGSSPYPESSPYSMNRSVSPYLSSSSYPSPEQMYCPSPAPKAHSKNMAYYATGEGTVKPFPNFDPKLDAEVLRKAMKGLGTDEKAIISVLANRSNSQRVYIGVAFKQLYGKDLIDDLKNELSGNFERVILGLMMPTNDYLANELHNAISGIGTDEDVLIEILCTRTNQEIWGINESYSRLFGKSMESDIKSDTSGHFQRMLVSACTGARSEAPADSARAKQTADALYQAGVAQWGTDESVFNSILVAESFQQLAHTFYEYQKVAGHTVAKAIESEMSGDLKKGMLAIAKCVENKPFYFAEKLYKSMKVGLGTDDNTLIRIVVSRCEIDMVQIKAEYERNYGKPLAAAIADDTSGDYKRVLIALVNPN